MTVILHPAAVNYYDELLLEELLVVGDCAASLAPILRQLAMLLDAIHEMVDNGADVPLASLAVLSATIQTLQVAISHRANRLRIIQRLRLSEV